METQTMVQISASMVKELREKSGAAMMDCKKALVESAGDFDKAFEWLRQKGAATASKKASRATSEGLVTAKVSPCGKHAAILEVNCETDFVARNEQFKEFCAELVDLVLEHKPADATAFLALKTAKGTVEEIVAQGIAKTGENIVVKRLVTFDVSDDGVVGSYVHALGGKMGALIELSADKPVEAEALLALGRDLAMQIVSTKPQYLCKEDVPAEVVEEERRIEMGKADLANRKPEIQEQMVKGRLEKILAERCFLPQAFVKEPSLTVEKLLANKSKELGAEIKPVRFALYVLGEAE